MNSRHNARLAVAMVLAAPVLAGCSLFDPQRSLTLREVVNSEYDAPDATTQAEDITDTACVPPLACVEAYSTAEANYYRFDGRKGAEDYGALVKDGFVINYFVMDFAGKDASVDDQLAAMQGLAGTWNDYEGDFPDRE